jgi:hypothetical protein
MVAQNGAPPLLFPFVSPILMINFKSLNPIRKVQIVVGKTLYLKRRIIMKEGDPESSR